MCGREGDRGGGLVDQLVGDRHSHVAQTAEATVVGGGDRDFRCSGVDGRGAMM